MFLYKHAKNSDDLNPRDVTARADAKLYIGVRKRDPALVFVTPSIWSVQQMFGVARSESECVSTYENLGVIYNPLECLLYCHSWCVYTRT
ncbi:hypothetical protein MTO96_051038 [Rhipicephalus appendiculatus]